MMVFVVVPMDEVTCPGSGVLRGAEPVRIAWLVLHRLELRLGVRVVVGRVGSGKTLGQMSQVFNNMVK